MVWRVLIGIFALALGIWELLVAWRRELYLKQKIGKPMSFWSTLIFGLLMIFVAYLAFAGKLIK